jgi:PKHD-type hydroxylase
MNNQNIARRAAYHRVFDREETALLLSKSNSKWRIGSVDHNVHDDSLRSAGVQATDIHPRLWKKLYTYVYAANQTFWKFDLDGLQDDDPPQLLQYSKGDHYDWHIDHDSQSSTRKLTCIVQLSDAESYTGGDICFFPTLVNSSSKDWRSCGSLIVFPVYVPHRVTRIKSGVRHALVFWIHGPSFR